MVGARLVGGDVLGGDDRVERNGEPSLRQGDDVAIAVGQQGEFPAFFSQLTKGGTHVAERRPVGNRRDERRRIIWLEVERKLPRGAAGRLREDRPGPPKRSLRLDLGFRSE